jgi:hypothetical protein
VHLRLGSRNNQVRTLEQRLKTFDHYSGPIDGIFGGSVENGVKQSQKQHGFEPDGIVGPETWSALFAGTPQPASAWEQRPLAERCLAFAGAFETTSAISECFAGLTGDFDGEGIGLGLLQWNIGEGTLQPLFSQMLQNHPEVLTGIFQENLSSFCACCRFHDSSSLPGGLRSKAPIKPTSSSPGGASCQG